MAKPKRKYRSRFGTEPLLDDRGKSVIIEPRNLTHSHVEALKCLAVRRTLNADYIAAVIGCTPKHIRDEFSILRSKGNEYVRLVDEQTNNPKQYLKSKLYYELAEAGLAALSDRHIEVRERPKLKRLKHQVMIDEIMASWQIGFNQHPELRPYWWPEIRARGTTPAKTREAKNGNQIPVIFSFDGKKVDKPYIADDRPFGFVREDRKGYFFPGIEADCHSESVRSDHDAYSSLKRKVLQQVAILDQELYRSHFGFPNMFFPYYFPTLRRMESAMGLAEELTEYRPSLRKSFLFAIHPTFTNFAHEKVQPSGWALTNDYKRVGCEPMNFSK